jgi:AcrR family transcriptional regulator
MSDAGPSGPPGFVDGDRDGDADGGTHEAIRAATYRALCRHGYHDTTIQRIADEFEKSKSLLYYHYEDKDELLADFLSHLLDHLAEILEVDEGDPEADLRALIDRLVPSPMCDEDRRFRRVVLELRARAPYDPIYREQFERSDALIRGAFADAIARGVETGHFRDVDPATVAGFVHTALLGAMERGVTLDDPEAAEQTRRALLDYVDRSLVADPPHRD